jgi:hypothetical protein
VLPNAGGRDVYLAKIDYSTGLPDVSTWTNDLLVYPMPASETLFVRCNEELKKVTLISLSAQTLSASIPYSTELQIDLRSLKPGFYFLNAETISGCYVKKVLVQ